jgi:dsRNA-specific ribonuclease
MYYHKNKKDLELEEQLNFYYGRRDESFRNLIASLLSRGKIKDKYIDSLLSPQAMKEYDKAFTSITVTSVFNRETRNVEIDKNSSDNYEIYEKLGDGVFDNFIGWYASRRFFPDNTSNEHVKVLHIIRSKYGSKDHFSPIAEKLGFWNFISSSIYQRNHQKKKLLEDVFEAFLGATSYILDKIFCNGIGYAICYDILESIYDEIPISEDFYEMQDDVSKLDQLIMKHKYLGKLEYEFSREDNIAYAKIYQIDSEGYKTFICEGSASIKKDAKKNAAKKALKYFEDLGIKRDD